MTSHEFAQRLLELPDKELMVVDSIGPQEISYPKIYTITQEDEDNCGSCDGLVGEEVIAFYVN